MKEENTVKYKSFQFSLQIIKVCKYLIEDCRQFILSNQLLRSGTSIGAQIREAEHAESKADFIHKMAIAQKEANETAYWLELLDVSGIYNKDNNDLYNHCAEIQKMLASIIITSKQKQRK